MFIRHKRRLSVLWLLALASSLFRAAGLHAQEPTTVEAVIAACDAGGVKDPQRRIVIDLSRKYGVRTALNFTRILSMDAGGAVVRCIKGKELGMPTNPTCSGAHGTLLALLALLLVADFRLAQAAEPPAQDPFAGAVFRTRDARTGRISSCDKTGGNTDFISFKAGETKELVRLDGPGAITHIYLTPAANRAFLRTAVLRMYWDDEPSPSVETPLGDFFCAGDCNPRLFASRFVVVNHGSGTIGYNAYFPMPFRKRARITLENCGQEAVAAFWYHVEYEFYDRELPADTAYFHAHWRRENPTKVNRADVPADKVNRTLWDGRNATGKDDYVILEAEGTGHVVGLYLTCHNLAGGWWGEGDDMIFIDGEKWPPSYHGTGTEEIFGGGACPNLEYAGPYTGFLSIREQEKATWRGQNSMYRWFAHDPIRFRRSIRWTIEHGHANNFENDYSSVAYWYQTEPHNPFPPLPADRLPPGGVPKDNEVPPIPGAVEAEDLLNKSRHEGGETTVVRPGASYGRGAVVVFLPKSGNASLSFRLPVEKAGRWRISGRFARASDMGRYQLFVNGRELSAPTDFFNDDAGLGPTHVVPTGEIVFGETDLEAGECELKFQCIGKAGRSGGFFLAVDALALQLVQP